jgi:hypothetical protein
MNPLAPRLVQVLAGPRLIKQDVSCGVSSEAAVLSAKSAAHVSSAAPGSKLLPGALHAEMTFEQFAKAISVLSSRAPVDTKLQCM